MRSLYAALVLLLALAANAAVIAQTGPVPMNSVNYGPGREDASRAFEFDGKNVSLCGRVGWVDPAHGVIVIADILRVFLQPGTDAQSLWAKVACAKGTVEVRVDGGMRLAVISPAEQIDVISGTGPFMPPQPQCGPGQMFDPQTGGCVKRWRASPY